MYSGGKDSNLALIRALELKGYKVKALITLKPQNKFSWMFHYPNLELTHVQADLLDLPLVEVKTKGEKEKELEDLKRAFEIVKEEFGVEGIVSGAVLSAYQNARVNQVSSELGLYAFSPLWLTPEKELLEELQNRKFKVIISRVSAYGLDKNFLGKSLFDALKKAKYINLIGEGGEYETLTLYQPFLKGEIVIRKGRIVEFDEYSADFVVEDYVVLPRKRVGKENVIENPIAGIAGNNNVLIVDLTTQPLAKYEFVLPLWRIFKGKIVHWSQLNKIDLNSFDTIVLTGTSLMDFGYLDFDVSEIVKSGKKVIGICAGFQLLAEYFNLKLVKRKTIGLKTINYEGKPLRTFFLTHYLADKRNAKVKIVGTLADHIVAFEKGNVKAFAFHPEYNYMFGENLF